MRTDRLFVAPSGSIDRSSPCIGLPSAPTLVGGLIVVLSDNVRMDITDLIQEDIVTVNLDDSLIDVAEVFLEERVGSAVVVDASDEVIGIVTDRDLVIYGQNFIEELDRTAVNEVLAMSVFSVEPTVSVLELTERMREAGVRRVPVMEDGELLGIVTLDDVIVHLADELESPELENLAAVIESESPTRDADGTE
ncbi:CBS domain-containing protein [Natronomonas sp. CBA1123]|nr:CBS domain-containing protein [Natronomonas sp. CBA1123]